MLKLNGNPIKVITNTATIHVKDEMIVQSKVLQLR